jgi:hypothetical protein
MADVATPDGSAPVVPVLRDPDAPPSSAGSAGQSEVRPGPLPMTEELKARLDKVIYSDVGDSYHSFIPQWARRTESLQLTSSS